MAAAIWIGCDYHWVGLAWIPIGVLLILAIVGNLVPWICASFIRFGRLCLMYQLAYNFSRMSPMGRERMLSRMDPDFREYLLNWINRS